MVVAKLPILSPTPIFAVAFLLAILLLGLAIVSRFGWVAAVALLGTWAVERAWHTLHFSSLNPAIPFGWYVIFALLFIGYAFFAQKGEQLPWAVSAACGRAPFLADLRIVSSAYPQLQNGFLPAAFIVPYAFGVFYLVKRQGIQPASGDARLAWQGGAALFSLVLIFPIQFDREWITLGWALEGLALIWLFRESPASRSAFGWRRIALRRFCPARPQSSRARVPQTQWSKDLELVSLCLRHCERCSLLGARLFGPPRENVLERISRPLLYSLGMILTFLLLNIEIADYFSIGPTLTFSFSGNFARDMTYSIAWALFAFALLLIGMKQKIGAVRYAGVALLLVTLAKLFLHDLNNLNQLYRIGAFIGVALILIVASFLYQRLSSRLRPSRSALLEFDAFRKFACSIVANV